MSARRARGRLEHAAIATETAEAAAALAALLPWYLHLARIPIQQQQQLEQQATRGGGGRE